jgi:membrane protease subunit HflK
MPWENNEGGGGRNTGGPWGQSPGGGSPRRPSGNTPNLEDLLNRGRDRFRGGLPGGRWAIVGGVLVLIVFWAFQAVYTVDPQEVGVEFQFGRPKPELSTAGLHFMFWPVESVEKVSLTENLTEIGSINTGRNQNSEGQMLSSDQNIVDVQFSVLWQVSDPEAFIINVRDPEDMVRAAAESAMREVVGRSPVQDVFRDNRAGIQLEVMRITQAILDGYNIGVRVGQIAIEDAAPPPEVADAFNEVQRAEQDEDRFQDEARSYANTLLGSARGQAAQMGQEAAAYNYRVVEEAKGQAARFISIYNEYVNAPDVTRKRLFLETMEQILGGSTKVIIENGAQGSGVVPYLPLPELRTPSSTTTTTTTPEAN